MRRVKTAVIGAGFIGRAHIEAVRRLGYVDIVAIGQSDPDKAAKFAGELNIPKAYGNYMELLQDEEIEAIHNCTPNHIHFEINKQALLHGKHILSEKPLTLTSQEAKQLYELAAGKQLVAGINFNYRQFPMVQQLKCMIQDGDLGKVRIVRGSYLQDWLLYDTDYNWRMEPEYGGTTRAISDIGSHLFDLLQYVTGQKIVEVMADASIVIPQRYKDHGKAGQAKLVDVHTEDYCSVLVKFSDGARGALTVSQVSAGNKNALEICIDGSTASGTWKQEEPFLLNIGHRDKPRETISRDPSLLKKDALPFLHYPGGHEEGWTDSLKNMMAYFYEAVSGGKPLSGSVASFQEGYRIMLIIDAIVKSAQSGCWEKVAEAE
ncbi:Predicted dehydrogenase [Paenibacillus sp. UNCCL117]|uniref:Gfo/Idh/MocA family protein n=1 Tax=unclassified Paenibacillus TaxID=185978 RepID=UPI00088DE279|nr:MULTISPECIES: Gfo/Idh/MocA family oxidoreductase [unclassified Paenibacillus]SDD55656.1 Predicted dehydrogenase [Paenibacillus sp. cl123]SFW51543.1 Predicted dehydrogenase [Paenibacillus sp. UNCCL117]